MDGPVVGDAFGEALRACWDSGAAASTVYEIVERDDGFIRGGNDMARYFAPPDAWSRIERAAVEEAKGRVLDIGCGGGRHLAELRDSDARGVDGSPGAVAVCRDRGLDVDHRDITDLDGTYDTLLLLGNNLGLLGSPETAPEILDSLAGVAAPGARILAGGSDPMVGASPPRHAAYHARNIRNGRPPGQLTIRVRYEDTATPWFDYWFMAADDLAGVVEGSPWRLDRVTADGAAYIAALTRR